MAKGGGNGSGGGGGRASGNSTPVIQAGMIPKPKNLLTAISEIQQFSMGEKHGVALIPKEFFTLEQRVDFFSLGAVSGLKESLWLFFLVPPFSLWVIPRVLHYGQGELSTLIMMGFIPPHMWLIVNTILCLYTGKYYYPNMAKLATDALFMGRMVALMVMGMAMYIAFYFLFYMSTPENIYKGAMFFGARHARGIYTWWAFEATPRIMPMADRTAIVMAVATITPLLFVWIKEWRRARIARRMTEMVQGISTKHMPSTTEQAAHTEE